MIFLLSQILLLLSGLFGLMVWAGSDMPLAVREIALNTRRTAEGGSRYVLIRVLSVCMKILAVVIWIFGIVILVAANTAGNEFGSMLRFGPPRF
jgi:hypothetical protein